MGQAISTFLKIFRRNIPLFLLCIIVFLLGFIFLHDQRDKNIVDDKRIAWSPEWSDISGEAGKETAYSGSSFLFAFRGSKLLRISLSTLPDEQNVKLRVDLNGQLLYLENPNINQKEFAIHIPSNRLADVENARVTWFCSGSLGSCKVKMQQIILQGGKLLDVPLEKRKRLAVLGDSISLTRLDKNYSQLVADRLGYSLHDASVWGGTVGQHNGKKPAILRFEDEIVAYKPDLLIFFMGINDVNQRSSSSEFRDNYSKIIDGIAMALPQAKILTVGLLPGKDPTLDIEQRSQFSAIIRDIAYNKKISYLDSSSWLSSDDYDDQFHPSITGQEKIANKITDYIISNKLNE